MTTPESTSPAVVSRPVAVLACGVLEWNIRRLLPRLPGRAFALKVFPAQLHASPRRLRAYLQEEIDRLDAEVDPAAVVIAYGVCGRGTLELHARRAPLVLPRVQDCIGLYLGSHARYIGEFRTHPGTRYMTEGWYDKTVRERPAEAPQQTTREASLYGPAYADLAERYGEDNARFICEFRESWKRNYRRACYIRFPGEADVPPGQTVSEGMAGSLGWEHQVLDGDDSLLWAMLNGDWSDPRLLLVPPRHKTVGAPGSAVIGYTAGLDAGLDEVIATYAKRGPQGPVRRTGIGLGIDTGGTYTDAVLYDFAVDRVLTYAKAITTHEDLIVGIRAALARLPRADLLRVRRVGISTTLATNAFVERKGRPVALFVMSPVDIHLEALPFGYVRRLTGAMSMDGEEVQAVDAEQVRVLAREAQAAGCEAFAISGFASVVDPRHEQQVARLTLEATGLHAVCGHELSTDLNFMERATTAAMNAKLVPLIESLLDAIERALADTGLSDVPVMVVKGDGSQMLGRAARQTPVETVLSGPAASVVGAARLFDRREAVVVDMGGTTLDVARLHNGAPVLASEGARIGDFQTSVRAMDVHTSGLGGDSEVDPSAWPAVRIGPRRILPICRLAEAYPAVAEQIRATDLDSVTLGPNCLEWIALAPGVAPDGPLLRHLANGPRLIDDVARAMNRACAAYIPWAELETEGRLRRYGLTLTDILHVEGRFLAFDRHAAEDLLGLWTALLRHDRQELIDGAYHQFRRMVTDEVLGVLLPTACPWEHPGELRGWLTGHLADTGGRPTRRPADPVRFQVGIDIPMIPVGAPVAALFPQLRDVLHQEILVSEYACVANALGAVAGDVLLREAAAVRITEDGAFLCSWRGGSERATGLLAAVRTCETALDRLIRAAAEANAIPYAPPAFRLTPQQAVTRDGSVLLGLTLSAELRG